VSRASSDELLVLHAVRLRGMADTDAVARRFGLDAAKTEEMLLDAEAYGWIRWAEFAGIGGWSLTERGKAENERMLARELDDVDRSRAFLYRVHHSFLPLNARLRTACTDWQIRPRPGAALAHNAHDDAAWDARVLAELAALATALTPLVAKFADVLPRFRGYDTRFAAALGRVQNGDLSMVDGSGRDSCHAVWFELHEDLIATLGLAR
jgi:hypothetical protein